MDGFDRVEVREGVGWVRTALGFALLGLPGLLFPVLLGSCLDEDAAGEAGSETGRQPAGASATGHIPAQALAPTRVSGDFESGSIGAVERIGNATWAMSVRPDDDRSRGNRGDMDASAAPPVSRGSWWHVRFDQLPMDQPVTILVTGLDARDRRILGSEDPSASSSAGVLADAPVYSYDRKTWHRVDAGEVLRPTPDTMLVSRRFVRPTVWLARSRPYTHGDLQAYLDTLEISAHVERSAMGMTAQGRAIDMLTITDHAVAAAGKARIWIYARSQPEDVWSSFVVEGLIEFLLSDQEQARDALAQLVFHIVPMHNVDGVIAGNQRTTPGGEPLASAWRYDEQMPWNLEADAPQEVRVLHDAIVSFQEQSAPMPVTMALALRSTGAERAWERGLAAGSEPGHAGACAWMTPRFGPEAQGYSAEEARLWTRQMDFMTIMEQGLGWNPSASMAGHEDARFLSRYVPETWWWLSFGAEVMAASFDATCASPNAAPADQAMGTPAQMRAIGRALGRAIAAYHGIGPGIVARAPGRARAARSAALVRTRAR